MKIRCIILTVFVHLKLCSLLHTICKLLQHILDYAEVDYSHERRRTGITVQSVIQSSNPSSPTVEKKVVSGNAQP